MDTNQATDMLLDITQYLNNIIRSTGQAVEINNRPLWQRYMNSWTNQDWDIMLTGMEQLAAQDPELFKPWHVRAIQEARSAWLTQRSAHDRILDTRRYKRRAWSAVMTIREIINQIQGVDLPNQTAKVTIYTQPQETQFGRLFTN